MKSDNCYSLDKLTELGPGFHLGLYSIIGFQATDQKEPTKIGKNANIRSHTVIYSGNIIGDNFQTGHGVLIRGYNKLGDNVSIGSHTVVEHHVRIGNNVRIHSNSFIPEFTELRDDVWIGPNVILTNAKYPASKNAKKNLTGPVIFEGAKIGAGSVILPGVTIGRQALVGAGSVVTKNLPDYSVSVGNPARIINDVRKIRDNKSNPVYFE